MRICKQDDIEILHCKVENMNKNTWIFKNTIKCEFIECRMYIYMKDTDIENRKYDDIDNMDMQNIDKDNRKYVDIENIAMQNIDMHA